MGWLTSPFSRRQEKLNVLKLDNHFGLADGPDFFSDRILKFEAGSIPNLLLNEFLSLRLAREAGFVVNDARLISIPRHRVLEIIRFDRTVECVNGNVVVRRRHVIDGWMSGPRSCFRAKI